MRFVYPLLIIEIKISEMYKVKVIDIRNRWGLNFNDNNSNPMVKRARNMMIRARMWLQAASHFRNHEIPLYITGNAFSLNLEQLRTCLQER